MKKSRRRPSAERVRELLSYCPDSGLLRWRVTRPGGKANCGDIAGHIRASDGYVTVKVGGLEYKAPRIIWLIMTGCWPANSVDHRDNNRSNNRWDNLREATHAEQQKNRKNWGRYPKGVTKQPYDFIARIWLNGASVCLGRFKTADEAHAAYCKAAAEHHGEFAKT